MFIVDLPSSLPRPPAPLCLFRRTLPLSLSFALLLFVSFSLSSSFTLQFLGVFPYACSVSSEGSVFSLIHVFPFPFFFFPFYLVHFHFSVRSRLFPCSLFHVPSAAVLRLSSTVSFRFWWFFSFSRSCHADISEMVVVFLCVLFLSTFTPSERQPTISMTSSAICGSRRRSSHLLRQHGYRELAVEGDRPPTGPRESAEGYGSSVAQV